MTEPRHHRFAAIDFETANPKPESACAVGVAICEGGRVIDRIKHFIRPPHREFRFTHVHGLTWIDVKDAPDFATVWLELSGHLDEVDFIAAHNARFDSAVLHASCATYGLQPPSAEWICSVRTARSLWRVSNADLASMARFLCIPLNHHEPLSDATACAEIMLAAELDGWSYSEGREVAGLGRN